MPNSVARAPGCSPLLGRQQGFQAARPQRREIDADRAACRASASAWSGQPRNSVTRSLSSSRRVVSGCGISSVTRVAPASSADSIPLPKPPTQKNGIGRYSRVSEVMQRAARPDCTAPNALPWECTTPLGAPLLPEVNMMTSGSAAVTVSVMASTIRRARSLAAAWSSRSTVQTWRKRRKFELRQHRARLEVVEIAVAAELLDAHQELHRGDSQLRDQFAGLQQRAQRNQHRADAGQCDRDLHPAGAVGHDQPDPGALADAGFDEDRGQIACGRVEFAVAEPGRWDRSPSAVAPSWAARNRTSWSMVRAARVRHRTASAAAACRLCRWTAAVFRRWAGR